MSDFRAIAHNLSQLLKRRFDSDLPLNRTADALKSNHHPDKLIHLRHLTMPHRLGDPFVC
jgi:hypothetical protein